MRRCRDNLRRHVVSRITPLMQALKDRPIHDEADLVGIAGLKPRQLHQDFALATAVSALRTALVDIQAQREAYRSPRRWAAGPPPPSSSTPTPTGAC